MNTIVRSHIGNYVIVNETVAETVRELAKKPGYIKIEAIQTAINNQLPDRREHLTRKMVVHALVKILAKSHR